MIQLGQTVGNYRVTALLGEGGMGAVFLAEHPVIGRRVALKVVHPQHARSLEVVARFVNEAAAISRIGHEHIVEVMDLGRTPEGDFYFVMEHLDGHPLSELLTRQGPLPPARAISIAAQIADALAASHEHGVVHRDVKPENVFLVRRGHDTDFVKVLDFGLAKLLDGADTAAAKPRAGTVMGTPYYMAPEQCRAEGEVDHRSDVYALGVVLFEMLTGKLPFGGEVYSEVLVKQVTMRPPWVRSIIPDVPEALDAIVQCALAKHPDDRFPSMIAFREALLAPQADDDGALPYELIADDRSSRMRDARPMSRAEIVRLPHARRERTPQPVMIDDPSLDRVPRHPHGRALALVGATLGGVALAAFVTRGDAALATAYAAEPPRPELEPHTVLVRFGSDPDGATVLAADGTSLGATPLSVQVPASGAPVEYVFRKPGFAPRSVSFVPNVPSTMFALLRAAEPVPPLALQPSAGPPAPPAVTSATMPAAHQSEARPHHHHETPPATQAGSLVEPPAPRLDDDGILEPSFDQ